jgi:hypothetical protein
MLSDGDGVSGHYLRCEAVNLGLLAVTIDMISDGLRVCQAITQTVIPQML